MLAAWSLASAIEPLRRFAALCQTRCIGQDPTTVVEELRRVTPIESRHADLYDPAVVTCVRRHLRAP